MVLYTYMCPEKMIRTFLRVWGQPAASLWRPGFLPGWLPSGNGRLYGGSGEAKNFMFDLWNDNLVLKGGSELEITQIVPKSWWQRYFQGTHLVSFCLPSHGVRTIQTRSGSPHLDLQKKASKFEQSGIVELPSWFVARSVASRLHCSEALEVAPPLLTSRPLRTSSPGNSG